MSFDIIGLVEKANIKADPKPCDSRTGTWFIAPTTDKGEEWLIRTVQFLGYDREDVLPLDPESEGAFNFERVEFLAECKHENWKTSLGEVDRLQPNQGQAVLRQAPGIERADRPQVQGVEGTACHQVIGSCCSPEVRGRYSVLTSTIAFRPWLMPGPESFTSMQISLIWTTLVLR